MSKTLNKKTADLSSEEKRALVARLLREKAGAAKASEPLAHQLIEAQAARTPDAIAVAFEGQDLTYRDLDDQANRLARFLKGLGVGPGSLVAVAVERSAEMVVALLGTLKAGAAYVPIDPEYPAERIAFMLDDARAAVVLTQARLRDRLPVGTARVVCLDDDWEAIGREEGKAPALAVRLDDLAYVIYTSGSTGRPKGVMVPHRALANFLTSMRRILGISGSDALLAVTTLCFDIAGLELFLPLTVGARVVVAPRDVAVDGRRLAETIAGEAISVLQATPATWRILLESGWEGAPGLTMLCGGEALPRDLAERLLPKGQALWNLYGPTETTIWSSAAKVETGEGPVPIGRPIAATQLYVLDAHLRPVPVGVAGELYIGGVGLARGYLGRPELTAERFLPDPHGQTRGARLYRTGDLARWRPDGSLECLGRVDHQVKIRGFRVELGEVETALARHPGVREAVAAAREDGSGENRLVAYLVPREGAIPGAADLRRALLETLPEYMVPSAFVVLDALPMTPNGKVDRKALPEPDPAWPASADVYISPRGPIEEAIATIWAELLGRDPVGARDNFFELGGHSLTATSLMARVQDMFGVSPALNEFFDAPTVAALARQVEAGLRAGTGLQTPPLRPADRAGELPSSFAQHRLWFLDQLEPGSAFYNIPIAVRLVGTLDPDALGRALNEIVRRHEVLRTTFAAVDGRPVQVIAPALEIAMPVEDLSAAPEAQREAEVERLVREESTRPFDLARGPLIRAGLIRLGEREHVALVNMHHIISDGWSIGVLVREVGAIYDAFANDRPSPLPEPPLQYVDYAVWQREWLQGDVLQAQLDYWKDTLGGVPPLELPTDRPRPPVLGHRGGEIRLALPKELVEGLRTLGKKEGVTPFMTLLAAFQALLQRYSGQDDLAIGTPIAGRTRPELEDLIGFFVNTLVLRGDLKGDPNFRVLLGRVKRSALSAYAHQDLPFEQLVGVLHPDRDPSRSPLFQVMFALQNAPLPALESPGLTMTPLPTESGTAKFDLTMYVTESDGGLGLALEYNTDLFDPATIERMLGHFRTLLEGIVADPDQTIATLPMLSEDERRRMLGQWGEPDDDSALTDLDGLSDEELDALMTDLLPEEGPTDEQ